MQWVLYLLNRSPTMQFRGQKSKPYYLFTDYRIYQESGAKATSFCSTDLVRAEAPFTVGLIDPSHDFLKVSSEDVKRSLQDFVQG